MPKIYILYNNENDRVYIGSTTSNYLTSRLAQHRYYYNKKGQTSIKYSSEKCFENDEGEPVQCFIDQLAEVTIDERYEIESYYIHLFKELNFNVVNLKDSIIIPQVYKDKQKKKYQKNPEKYRQIAKDYYLKNKERIKIKNANKYYLKKSIKDQINPH
jgi:hypothetical protein